MSAAHAWKEAPAPMRIFPGTAIPLSDPPIVAE
jgi:hypothetical protein